MNILYEAIKTYKEKNYLKALELFEEAAAVYGQKVVEVNIRLCKKALLQDTSNIPNGLAGFRPRINSYFDKIYLVNLRHEVKRRLTVALHLRNNQIQFDLHEATNGYEGEAFKVYQNYSKRALGDLKRYPEFKEVEIKRGKPFIESAGAIGYIYTYLSILRDAKDKKYKRILILEDDVILDKEFHSKFTRFIQSIPSEWKILQLGASQYNWTSVQDEAALRDGFYQPRRLDTCGSFAIAIDHTVFEELIEAEEAIESPFDHLALGELYERNYGECFVCYPNIIMPDVGSSSIRGGRNQHAHAAKMRWPIENFQYPLPTPSIAVFIDNSRNIKYLERFDAVEELPFQHRIYLNTVDGPRPVHNEQIFNKKNYNPTRLSSETHIPQADFVTKIAPQAVLSEDEIVAYLDAQLLDREARTSLKTLRNRVPAEIKDRVSVIIPTYKRPQNLSKALDSVIAQQYPHKEIIIISDNGENSDFDDETKKIIDFAKVQAPEIQIKLISHKYNRNGAAARNTGILHATGEYICFLDDDDIYLGNRIGATVERLKSLPTSTGAVYCGFLGWNSPSIDEGRFKAGDLTKDLLLLNYKSHYLHTNTATYRRSAIVELNGFDETYRRHQDIELNLRFFDKFSVDYVKEVGVRLNPEPSEVSNKIFNSAMLELKQKFLGRFAGLIGGFDRETQATIYRRHWEEVVRYSKDPGETDSYLASLLSNGPVQVMLLTKDRTEGGFGVRR